MPTRKTTLRAVPSDPPKPTRRRATKRTPAKKTTPAKPTPKLKTLAEAIADGDYLEILEAQQRQIATDIPGEKGPAKAAMHRQLALLSKEIDQLREAKKQEAAENGEGATEDEPLDASAL